MDKKPDYILIFIINVVSLGRQIFEQYKQLIEILFRIDSYDEL